MTFLINDLLFNVIRRPKENMWTCLRWFALSTVATSLERSPKEAIVLQWLRPWWERDDQQLVKPKSLEHADPLEEPVCLTPADSQDLAHSISFVLQFEGRKRFHRATNS
jgi:hypothetical protein